MAGLGSALSGTEGQDTHLVKVVLVGESATGKTCLLSRLFSDKFDPCPPSTIGTDFRYKKFLIDGQSVSMTIWDTAGQEKFAAVTTSYYRGAQAVVLVYDVTRPETLERLRTFWIPEFRAHATLPDAVMMIVGNKIDREAERKVSPEEGAALAREHGALFQETSAKTDVNVYDALVWGLLCAVLDTPSLLRCNQITPAVPVATTLDVDGGQGGGEGGRRRRRGPLPGCC